MQLKELLLQFKDEEKEVELTIDGFSEKDRSLICWIESVEDDFIMILLPAAPGFIVKRYIPISKILFVQTKETR